MVPLSPQTTNWRRRPPSNSIRLLRTVHVAFGYSSTASVLSARLSKSGRVRRRKGVTRSGLPITATVASITWQPSSNIEPPENSAKRRRWLSGSFLLITAWTSNTSPSQPSRTARKQN